MSAAVPDFLHNPGPIRTQNGSRWQRNHAFTDEHFDFVQTGGVHSHKDLKKK